MKRLNLPDKCCRCLKKPTLELTVKRTIYDNVKIVTLGMIRYYEVEKEITIPLCDDCSNKIKSLNHKRWIIVLSTIVIFTFIGDLIWFLFIRYPHILHWLFLKTPFLSLLWIFKQSSMSLLIFIKKAFWASVIGFIAGWIFWEKCFPVKFKKSGIVFRNKEYQNEYLKAVSAKSK